LELQDRVDVNGCPDEDGVRVPLFTKVKLRCLDFETFPRERAGIVASTLRLYHFGRVARAYGFQLCIVDFLQSCMIAA
jgi:hypothetical protein